MNSHGPIEDRTRDPPHAYPKLYRVATDKSRFVPQGSMLHIKVRSSGLLCAVKTVEGDLRFCLMISPNVGQTQKENPNLVRIFYMTFTLNDIYKQYNKLHEH